MIFQEMIKKEFWANRLAKLPVVLISGRIGSGKTYLARKLAHILIGKDIEARIFSFASPIKEIAQDYFYWNGMKDEGGRRLLQNLGAVGREYDENIWVNITNNLIQDVMYNSGVGCIIIDDWRFPNEFRVLKDSGLYYITTVRMLRTDLEIFNNDLSEVSLSDNDTYDFVFDNNIDYPMVYIEEQINQLTKKILGED